MSPQLVSTLIYLVVFAGIFYIFLVRPQLQRQREQASLVASLAVGDQVITAGGIYGTIRTLDEETFELEVADGVVIKVARAAVSRKLEA